MSLLKRQDTAFYVATDGDIRPLVSGKVTVYDIGAIANGTNSDTTIPVYTGHGFAVGDCLMVNNDETTFRLVMAGTSALEIVVNSAVATVEGDVLVNLGTDTAGGSGTPNYNGSTVLIYAVPDTGTPITTPAKSQVSTDTGGGYEYYYPSDVATWELIRDSAGDPQGTVIRDSSVLMSSSTTGGLTPVTNAVARFSGTAGLILKNGFASKPVTIDDNGGITATGTHTLGSTGTFTTLSGKLQVAQASTLTGVVTAPAANILGATGNNTNILGTAAVTENLTVGGTAVITSTLQAAATTLAATTVTQLNMGVGALPTIGSVTNWGTNSQGSIAADGRANRFTATIFGATANGTANASFIVTFNETLTAAIPVAVVALNSDGSSSGATFGFNWSVTPTALTLICRGQPLSGAVYRFDVIIFG